MSQMNPSVVAVFSERVVVVIWGYWQRWQWQRQSRVPWDLQCLLPNVDESHVPRDDGEATGT
jgi:hypothetical protein